MPAVPLKLKKNPEANRACCSTELPNGAPAACLDLSRFRRLGVDHVVDLPAATLPTLCPSVYAL